MEKANSPTVASVILSCVIDANGGRNIDIVDIIPGAFVQAELEDLVHVKLEGKMAELLTKLPCSSEKTESSQLYLKYKIEN